MPIWFDSAWRIVEVLAALGVLKYLRDAVRLLRLFEDFPPHRHESDRILYPKRYSPGRVEILP